MPPPRFRQLVAGVKKSATVDETKSPFDFKRGPAQSFYSEVCGGSRKELKCAFCLPELCRRSCEKVAVQSTGIRDPEKRVPSKEQERGNVQASQSEVLSQMVAIAE